MGVVCMYVCVYVHGSGNQYPSLDFLGVSHLVVIQSPPQSLLIPSECSARGYSSRPICLSVCHALILKILTISHLGMTLLTTPLLCKIFRVYF